MSTFREAIKEIQRTCPARNEYDFVKENCPYYPADREKCEKCDVDRILAAYKAKVEGMEGYMHFASDSEEMYADVETVKARCKSYLLEEGE